MTMWCAAVTQTAETQIERREHQNHPNVGDQPRPEMMPEKQHVDRFRICPGGGEVAILQRLVI